MKTLSTTLLVLSMSIAAVMSTMAHAAEHKHEGGSSSESQKGHAHMEKMHTHMKMMKIQMQEVHEEQDPEKRKQLMQAHRQSMHEGMSMMHDMGGKGMMGMMHGGEMHHGMKDKSAETPKKMDEHARMGHMEERMDMMQMMMEQMMQHQAAHEAKEGELHKHSDE